MRLSYRLNLSLIAGVAVTSLAFTFYQTIMETRGLRAEAVEILRKLDELPTQAAEARS